MMINPYDLWIKPDWPVPNHVKSWSTTRLGGVSSAEYDSLNLGLHVGDNPQHVLENRHRLQSVLGYEQAAWLEQTHSTKVVRANSQQILNADASWTDQPHIACIVMTADCLPVLFCDKSGQYIAAAHAGWRGLLNGVLEETIQSLPVPATELMTWLGPAIGANQFEVGVEVKEAFESKQLEAKQAFKESINQGRFLANIYQLAELRLIEAGVTAIYGGDFCTMSDEQRFFSYRRHSKTGRMASLIWLSN